MIPPSVQYTGNNTHIIHTHTKNIKWHMRVKGVEYTRREDSHTRPKMLHTPLGLEKGEGARCQHEIMV